MSFSPNPHHRMFMTSQHPPVFINSPTSPPRVVLRTISTDYWCSRHETHKVLDVLVLADPAGHLLSAMCIQTWKVLGMLVRAIEAFWWIFYDRWLSPNPFPNALYQRFLIDLKRPEVIETREFSSIDYALITAKEKVKIRFVKYLNFNEFYLNWSAWPSTVITAVETHLNLISQPHHHTNSYPNNREAWALVHKIRNQDLGPCLRSLKKRQKRVSAKTGQAKICYLISLWR